MVTDPTTGNLTTGPLLDWWYVHAGYAGFKDGISRSWDVPMGIEIEAQPAERSEPILPPDRPWEQDGAGPVTSFIFKDGLYIIDYTTPAGLCRAQSEDGYNWTKPEFGAVEFEGSTKNNIVTTRYGRIFEDPSAPPEERFKAIGGKGGFYAREKDTDGNYVEVQLDKEAVARMGGPENPDIQDHIHLQEWNSEKFEGEWGTLKSFMMGAVSPDGFNWTYLEKPLLEEFVDGDNIVFYDEVLRQYVGYCRFHIAGRRCAGRCVSDDFRTFTPEQLAVMNDALDPPDVSFYNHAYTRYPGRNDLHLMFLSRFAQSAGTKDIQLGVSHDGINWERPDRTHHLIDNYADGAGYGAALDAGPGLLEMPDGRYAITYWGTDRKGAHDSAHVNLPIRYALWEKDRIAGIRAKADGRLTLRQDLYRSPPDCPDAIPAPIHNRFPPLADPNEPPRQLRLNYKTETGGFIKVELITHVGPKPHLSGSLSAMEGYSFADCDVLQGDELDRVVTWRGNDNVARLSDSLAIRIEMYKATLFAFSL